MCGLPCLPSSWLWGEIAAEATWGLDFPALPAVPGAPASLQERSRLLSAGVLRGAFSLGHHASLAPASLRLVMVPHCL